MLYMPLKSNMLSGHLCLYFFAELSWGLFKMARDTPLQNQISRFVLSIYQALSSLAVHIDERVTETMATTAKWILDLTWKEILGGIIDNQWQSGAGPAPSTDSCLAPLHPCIP
jgi:hypothetical protein